MYRQAMRLRCLDFSPAEGSMNGLPVREMRAGSFLPPRARQGNGWGHPLGCAKHLRGNTRGGVMKGRLLWSVPKKRSSMARGGEGENSWQPL